MIVNGGKLLYLQQQLTYQAGLYWGLFTNNATVSDTTVFADLTEAAWTSYARVLVGSMQSPVLVANKAVSVPNAYPVFGNGSGATQTFYGWFLYDNSASKLVAAVNLGAQAIAAGASYPLVPSLSDNDVAG